MCWGKQKLPIVIPYLIIYSGQRRSPTILATRTPTPTHKVGHAPSVTHKISMVVRVASQENSVSQALMEIGTWIIMIPLMVHHRITAAVFLGITAVYAAAVANTDRSYSFISLLNTKQR